VSASRSVSRIARHPILEPLGGREVAFTFNGRKLTGIEGEAVSSALFASGIQVFGHHPKDGAAQGMYCANGQCSQCTLLIDGLPLKSCIEPLREGMVVRSLEGLPVLEDRPAPDVAAPRTIDTQVLILGAGPSGMAAAAELGRAGVRCVLVDDKDRLGGKLVLQTHKFFGSVADCHAGTRGTEIAGILAGEIAALDTVTVWLESVALAVFSDGAVGIRHPEGYRIVRPEHLLVTTGAREQSLSFPGNTLAGVYGAGAFQTLVNRDQVHCAERIFVVGGGNVGLIAAYHALQADMTVVGVAEAMASCGGYQVHADKIARLGVPIHLRHSILAAHGEERVEAVTIAEVDDRFRPLAGTEKTFRVDTVLVAVGLSPVDEFHAKASEFGMRVWRAGDAEAIAEASAAMFTGRIRGREIARALGAAGGDDDGDWAEKAAVLKSPGGERHPYETPALREGVFPVLHCNQEIPCNPCITSCPHGLITTEGHPILGVPHYGEGCGGCLKCVGICPGLAITMVDWRADAERPTVTVPFELGEWRVALGETYVATDIGGAELGTVVLRKIRKAPGSPRTRLLQLEAPAEIANRIAGIRLVDPASVAPEPEPWPLPLPDEAVVCRCERITAGEIRAYLRAGLRDLNELKALTRTGYGACGGKTCRPLLARLLREEGIPAGEVEGLTERPLFAETPLGYFAGKEEE